MSEEDLRLTKLETTVATLAQGLEAFVAESRTYRAEQRENEKALWGALEKNRPNITWPVIVTTCGFLLAAAGTLAALGHVFVELRVSRGDLILQYHDKELARHQHELEKLDDRLRATRPAATP